MQKTHDTGFYKNTGSLVKVIEVRTSFNFIDGVETNNYPLSTWVVVVENASGQPVIVHQYDQPVKAQRKFERLTKCPHERTSPAHDPDMRTCLDCDKLVPARELK